MASSISPWNDGLSRPQSRPFPAPRGSPQPKIRGGAAAGTAAGGGGGSGVASGRDGPHWQAAAASRDTPATANTRFAIDIDSLREPTWGRVRSGGRPCLGGNAWGDGLFRPTDVSTARLRVHC